MDDRTTQLRSEIEDTRDHMSGTIDAIGDRVIPGRVVERRRAQARASMQRARERVMGTRDDLGGRVSDTTGRVGSAASSTAGAAGDAASAVGGAVRDLPQTIEQRTEGSPLVAGALAFGAGLLIASLLPKTETEESVMPALAEPVKDSLVDMGRSVGETAKAGAEHAAEEAKGTATEAIGQVKQEAARASEDVKGAATDAAGQVRSSAEDAKEQVKPS
jgi:uncharacterized protein YjbJ (UPF0337 family)